jgi:putative thioredoxin
MQVEIKNDEELQAFIAATTTPAALIVTAEWCGPCKIVKPALLKLSEVRGFKVGMVNGGRDKDLAASLKVRSVPTVIVYRDGNETGRFAGSLNIEQLRVALGRFGVV